MKGMTPVIAIVVLLLITIGLLSGAWVLLFGYYETVVSKPIRTVLGSSYCREGSANIYINNMGISDINLTSLSQLPFNDVMNLADNSGFENLVCTNGNCMIESWEAQTSDIIVVIDVSSSMDNDCTIPCDQFGHGAPQSAAQDCNTVHTPTIPTCNPCPWPNCKDCDGDKQWEDTNEDCKFGNAQNASKIFLDQMDSNFEKVGLVAFDRRAVIQGGLTTNYTQLKSEIDNLSRDGWGTDIAGGIKNATWMLTQPTSSGDVKVQVLLSDGEPYWCVGQNVGKAAAIQCAKDQADNASLQGIRIYTIGLGVGAGSDGEDLLKYIANKTGGRYVSAPDSHDLVGIYINISEEITSEVSYLFKVYGNYSMKLEGGTNRKAKSNLIEIVDPSKDYKLWFYLRLQLTSGNINLTIYFYGANGVTEWKPPETLQTYGSSIDEFEKQEFDVSPEGASYIKISFEWSDNSIGTAWMDDVFLGPELMCTISDKTYTCGELAIIKTTGDGDAYLYFSKESIEPKGTVVLRDANCADEFCEYKIFSPSVTIDAGVNC